MRTVALTLALAGAAALLGGCTLYGDAYGSSYASGYGPPAGAPYYADQYYRSDAHYSDRKVRRNEPIYVGADGRYYCRRRDGTTGLILGIDSGVLNDRVPPGGSKSLDVLAKDASGVSFDVKHIRCR